MILRGIIVYEHALRALVVEEEGVLVAILEWF